jgi:glycosyltransferase involved in cell wall biosynthesis
MSRNILVVTPKYFPDACGVGDFSWHLVASLRQHGNNVAVVTSGGENNVPVETLDSVFRLRRWTWRGLLWFAKEIEDKGYTHLLIQYSPMGYSRKGALPLIAFLPMILKRRGAKCQVITTAHELFYVTYLKELRRIPRNATIGLCQRLMLIPLLRFSDVIVGTTDKRLDTIRRFANLLRLSANRTTQISISTNIAVHKMGYEEASQLKVRYRLGGKVVLGTFSGAPNKRWVVAALIGVRRAGVDAVLLAVGLRREDFNACGDEVNSVVESIIFTGYLAEKEVSHCLQAVDLLLLPFIDGISTRRGTLMAGLAHGMAIQSCVGPSTDMWMHDSTALSLSKTGDMTDFVKSTLELVTHPFRTIKMRADAVDLYESHFSWDVIISRYLSLMDDADNARSCHDVDDSVSEGYFANK